MGKQITSFYSFFLIYIIFRIDKSPIWHRPQTCSPQTVLHSQTVLHPQKDLNHLLSHRPKNTTKTIKKAGLWGITMCGCPRAFKWRWSAKCNIINEDLFNKHENINLPFRWIWSYNCIIVFFSFLFLFGSH